MLFYALPSGKSVAPRQRRSFLAGIAGLPSSLIEGQASVRVAFAPAFGLVALSLVLTASLPAQTAPAGSLLTGATRLSVQPLPTASFQDNFSARYSYSSQDNLEHGTKIGEGKISSFSFSDDMVMPASDDLTLQAGVSWSDTELKLSAGVPVPQRLTSAGIGLGVVKDFLPDWKVNVRVTPSVASDSYSFSGADFNLSGGLVFLYDASPDLSLDFGIAAILRGQYRALPVVGLRWNWADDWTLALGFPVTAVIYKVAPGFTLRLGAGAQGGTYHLDRFSLPGFEDTYLEYREIRAGLTAIFSVNRTLSFEAEGGEVLDRRFDYYERNYTLKGGSAAYFSLAARIRF